MKIIDRLFALVRFGLVPILFVATLPLCRGEVSIHVDPETNDVRSFGIHKAILDDPDPLGLVWTVWNTADASIALNPLGDTNQDGDPTMVMQTHTGIVVAAWGHKTLDNYDVVLSTFSDGTWTSSVALADSDADELAPTLILDPSTLEIHLIYWVNDASPRVMHRKTDQYLSSWSAPVQVSDPNQTACRPAAVLHDGVLHIVYEAWDSGFPATPRQIVLATLDQGSTSFSMVSTTQFQGESWPQVHSKRGHLWLDWLDADGELAWTSWSGGTWLPVQIEPYAGLLDLEFHARGRIKAQVLD